MFLPYETIACLLAALIHTALQIAGMLAHLTAAVRTRAHRQP